MNLTVGIVWADLENVWGQKETWGTPPCFGVAFHSFEDTLQAMVWINETSLGQYKT